MGDRRIAEIRTEDGSLYVYTHWNGYLFDDMARDAIQAARGRWDDPPYAMRIIVDQLTKDGRDLETGYGLMLKPDFGDRYNADVPSIIIDLVTRRLTVIDKSDRAKNGSWDFLALSTIPARGGGAR